MRLAVTAMRGAGLDVVYSAERALDPSDKALLEEAFAASRIFVTKEHDIGVLVHRDGQRHAGILLIDDLADAQAKAELMLILVNAHRAQLLAGAFVRVDRHGARIKP